MIGFFAISEYFTSALTSPSIAPDGGPLADATDAALLWPRFTDGNCTRARISPVVWVRALSERML